MLGRKRTLVLAAKQYRAFGSEAKQRVLSGIQPTGALHLGNYLGALRQWVKHQDQYDNYFCVVDLHAITAPHDPRVLAEQTKNAAALYLAAGLDPQKCTIFVQSHVSAHAELAWLLNCTTPISWLERMIQYKEKAKSQGENVSMGLFDYPVLMAADILLYQADLVPVGDDQKQHLELTREIARRFNDQYCKKRNMPAKGRRVFKEPGTMLVTEGARVMSLQDATHKMSKSAESDLSRINMLDDADTIRQKIRKCKTDNGFQGMQFDNDERPECHNLLTIYQAVTDESREDITQQCANMNWAEFKPLLTDALVAHLAPVQARYYEIREDEGVLDGVLTAGAEDANAVASQTLVWAKNAMGFAPPGSK
jgi:tryptophanyl-tRNA synthetase